MPASGPGRKRWRHAQAHERQYWQERGDVAAVRARRLPHYEAAFARLASLLPEQPLVVDVGSGPTCWAQLLPGTKVYVDPLMASYVERWGAELPEGFPIAAAGELLPLRSALADLVFSVNALDHCADPEAVVRECARLARPGGLVAISVYAHPRLRALLHRLNEVLTRSRGPHPFAFTRDTVPTLMRRCGLEVIEVLALGAVSFRTRLHWLKRTEALVVARRSGGSTAPSPSPSSSP